MLGYYVFLAVLMIVANWPNIIPLFLRDYVVYETINLISSWYIDEFLLVACVLFRSSKTWKVKIEFGDLNLTIRRKYEKISISILFE